MGFHDQRFSKIHFCLPGGMNFDPLNCVKRLPTWPKLEKYILFYFFWLVRIFDKVSDQKKWSKVYIFLHLDNVEVAFSRNLVDQSWNPRVRQKWILENCWSWKPICEDKSEKILKIWFFPKNTRFRLFLVITLQSL